MQNSVTVAPADSMCDSSRPEVGVMQETELPVMETDIFKMGAGTLVTTLLMRYGLPWLIFIAAVVVAGVVMAVAIDLRWIILALMAVFIIMPGIVALLYISKGFDRNCVPNVIRHTVSFYPQRVCIRQYRIVDPESEEGDDESDAVQDMKDNAAEGEPEDKTKTEILEPAGEIDIDYKDLGKYSIGVSSVTIDWGTGFLWLPAEAFRTPDGLARVVALLSERSHA